MRRQENETYEIDLDEDLQRELKRNKRRMIEERRRRRQDFLFVVCFVVTVTLLAIGVMYLSGKAKDEEESGLPSLIEQPKQSAEALLPPPLTEASPTETTMVPAAAMYVPAEETLPELPPETPAETLPEVVAEETAYVAETQAPPETPVPTYGPNVSNSIYIPSWIRQDFITVSVMNRPGLALSAVNNIVIHWVANPGSTAKDNRDYFENLNNPVANPENVSASAHFVVGLQGEIIQCVPVEEVAYANYPRNDDTISIETCHPDWTGQFNSDTFWAEVRLSAWLLEQYGLTKDALIRHYDVSGKDCPKYYVEHPEAWENFKNTVGQYMLEHPDIASEFP